MSNPDAEKSPDDLRSPEESVRNKSEPQNSSPAYDTGVSGKAEDDEEEAAAKKEAKGSLRDFVVSHAKQYWPCELPRTDNCTVSIANLLLCRLSRPHAVRYRPPGCDYRWCYYAAHDFNLRVVNKFLQQLRSRQSKSEFVPEHYQRSSALVCVLVRGTHRNWLYINTLHMCRGCQNNKCAEEGVFRGLTKAGSILF